LGLPKTGPISGPCFIGLSYSYTRDMQRIQHSLSSTALIPILAFGLVLAGCSDDGSPGPDPSPPDDGGGGSTLGTYPEPSSENSYVEEVAINLQSAGLGIRLEGENPDPDVLNEIYTGPTSDRSIRLISGSNLTFAQGTYGEIQSGIDLSAAISKDDLLRSDSLEDPDSPNPGTLQNADQLIRFYLDEAQHTSSNGVDLSQLSEKGVAGALTYDEGAQILNNFAAGTVESNRADKWNEAFGHFGAPRDFGSFLDFDDADGLVNGSSFQDANDDGQIDLINEAVYIWAGYTAERGALAEQTGNPNDFARRAFEAFREGREDIADGNDPSDHAETALAAWEATVAVNVIHYTNSMESALENIEGEITRQKLEDASDTSPGGFQDSWGEAKAFTWALQFQSVLSDSELETFHDKIGNDPPYSEGVTASDYSATLAEVQQTIQDAYGFAEENVEQW